MRWFRRSSSFIEMPTGQRCVLRHRHQVAHLRAVGGPLVLAVAGEEKLQAIVFAGFIQLCPRPQQVLNILPGSPGYRAA